MVVNTHRLDLVVCVVDLSPEEPGVRADIERPAADGHRAGGRHAGEDLDAVTSRCAGNLAMAWRLQQNGERKTGKS